jgi:hypothetical protein
MSVEHRIISFQHFVNRRLRQINRQLTIEE